MRFLLAFAGAISAQTAAALPLDLPAQASATAEIREAGADIAWPVTAFSDFDPVTHRAQGTVSRRAWHLPATSLTPLQLLDTLRSQLTAAGYDIQFECSATGCGGFDFRFALELIGEPDMHVDIGNYRYLVGETEDGNKIALMASRSATTGFLHISEVVPENAPAVTLNPAPAATAVVGTSGLSNLLETTGRAVLGDLTFATGSSELGEGPFASLEALAEFMLTRPDARITLVGHTDAEGSLSGNVALSKARAASVRNRLVTEFNLPAEQITSDGVGYLMPLAPNTSEEGRDLNRRVEVVLLGLE